MSSGNCTAHSTFSPLAVELVLSCHAGEPTLKFLEIIWHRIPQSHSQPLFGLSRNDQWGQVLRDDTWRQQIPLQTFLLIFFQLQLGQWGGVEFGSEERNEKFHRLLGAFKNTPSTQTPEANVSLQSSRRCMTKDTEESLTQTLQQQYESAMNFSRNRRGLGLGYNPDEDPSKKTFYIDKTGSKSVKLS